MTQHESPRTAHADLSTVTTSSMQRYRGVGVLAVVAAVAVTTSACGAIKEAMNERHAGHTKAFTYDTGADGKADEGLPTWVPDEATDIRGVFRTTGDEMILTMDVDQGALPDTCTPVDDAHPLVAQPDRGDLTADDYRTDATLQASWWTPGQEQDATLLCDGWWVGTRDGALFAFTPELKAIKIEDQPDAA